ncbi:hypothetical protein [Guptibacillus hwajinpoensis]|uniref:hypothetical protein n=1 Tax=Guptibacillus hwajinpoensis TaxID=208199 RepID=UPI0037365BC2
MTKKLSDFQGDMFYFIFNFPQYIDVEITNEYRHQFEKEVLEYPNENSGPLTLDTYTYYDSWELQFFKDKAVSHKFYESAYCPLCRKTTPFVHKTPKINIDKNLIQNSIGSYSDINITEEIELYEESMSQKVNERFEALINTMTNNTSILPLHYKCYNGHSLQSILKFSNKGGKYSVSKIGQYPPVFEFDISYRKSLDLKIERKISRELYTADKLKADNIGVGAVVYLRRIFEALMDETYETYKDELNVVSEEYMKKDTKGKIDVLANYLPSHVSDTKGFLYSLLSEVVHKLPEKKALEYIDTLKDAIMIILEQREEMKEKEKRRKKNVSDMNVIHSNKSK